MGEESKEYLFCPVSLGCEQTMKAFYFEKLFSVINI